MNNNKQTPSNVDQLLEVSDNIKTSTQELRVYLEDLKEPASDNTELLELIIEDVARIADGMQQISLSLAQSHFAESPLFSSLIGAATAAFAAFIFNIISWKLTKKKENTYSFIHDIIKIIDSIESTSVRYWLAPSSSDKEREIIIKSNLLTANACIKTLIEQIPKKKKQNAREILSEHGHLFDLITGEEFESASRNPCSQTATKISSQCTKIRAEVSSLVFTI